VQENGEWRERYNHELYELFNEPVIIKLIKINRLGWAGHVTRMGNNRIVKVFYTKPIEIRKIGRLMLRWECDVIQDIKSFGMKNWRNLAMENKAGRSF
jgi:hypothetical protein